MNSLIRVKKWIEFKKIADELKQRQNLDQVAATVGKPVNETGLFAKHEFVKTIGSDEKFISTAFSLSAENKFSNVVESKTGAYVLEFVEFQSADLAQFEANSDSLTNDMIMKKRRDAWSKWVNAVRADADIKDYRSYYYGG